MERVSHPSPSKHLTPVYRALHGKAPWPHQLISVTWSIRNHTLPIWSFLPKPVAAAMFPAPSTVLCATAVTPVTTASPTFVTCSLVFSATGIHQEQQQIKRWMQQQQLTLILLPLAIQVSGPLCTHTTDSWRVRRNESCRDFKVRVEPNIEFLLRYFVLITKRCLKLMITNLKPWAIWVWFIFY